MSEGERRLAAIMFTDIVGYTSLSQKDEALAMRLLDEHRRRIRPLFSEHNGREVKTTGDGFLVEFPSALEAVVCAYAIQQSMTELNSDRPVGKKIMLRIGIHLGDVIHIQNDIYGDAVNVASRIEPLAEPGGISLSQQVYDHIRNKTDLATVKVGEIKLKDLQSPLGLFKIIMPGTVDMKGEVSDIPTRLAVLPFVNISPDPNDEYLADGLTEELITKLSEINELKVIARTSVMNYKRTEKKIIEIGTELRVGSIIEGSVRKAGNRIRATVQLIDARNEEHLWVSNYDKQLDDIFAIQTEIAEKVAEQLRIRLVESDKRRLEKKPTTSTEAYTLYLKGRQHWNERSEEGTRRAIEFFNQAIKIDQNFALGYSGLADCYCILAHNAMAEFGPSYMKAKEYATKALSLDENLAEAHTALAGVLADYDRDWTQAESEFKRAIQLKPNYSSAHQWYGLFLGALGRQTEAEREIRQAADLDPLSLIINVNVGDALYYSGEFKKAVEQYRKVMDREPNFAISYFSAIPAYIRTRMYEEGIRAADLYANLTKRVAGGKLLKGNVYAAMGKKEEARRLLKEAEEGYHSEHLSPYLLGLAYIQMRDDDIGFQWLEKAYAEYDSALTLMNIDYEFDRLRNDPRYTALLKKLRISQVQPPA